jgi:ABC-type transport system substrate-binding protein
LDSGISFLEETLAIVKAQIEETGLAVVKLNGLPRFEYEEKAAAGELPFFLREWQPVIVDPLPSLQAFAACGGGLFCNDQLERLFLDAGNAGSTETYQSVIRQIDSLYASEVPAIPLLWEQELIAYYGGLEGIQVGATDVLYYK